MGDLIDLDKARKEKWLAQQRSELAQALETIEGMRRPAHYTLPTRPENPGAA